MIQKGQKSFQRQMAVFGGGGGSAVASSQFLVHHKNNLAAMPKIKFIGPI